MQIIITQGIEYHCFMDEIRALIRSEIAHSQLAAAPSSQAASDKLVTIKAGAAELNVSIATVHEWKRRGLLPFTKIGGRTYLKLSEILAAGTRQQRTVKPSRSK